MLGSLGRASVLGIRGRASMLGSLGRASPLWCLVRDDELLVLDGDCIDDDLRSGGGWSCGEDVLDED